MHIAVAIASKARPHVLADTLAGIGRQERPPDSVWVGVSSPDDLPEDLPYPGVKAVYSEVGLTTQRNAIIDALGDDVDLVVFLDDDTELHPTFLAHASEFAARSPDVALFGGLVVDDGVRVGEIPRDEARTQLAARRPREDVTDVSHVYGCCMAVRVDVARALRFDEALPLYGWLEDRDFTVRAGRHGRLVVYAGCELIHLGVSSGRQSGVRLGFQQVVHPVYLRRKGILRTGQMVALLGRPLLSNLVGLFAPDSGRLDRKGRLRGNMIGLREVLLHGPTPEHVSRLP